MTKFCLSISVCLDFSKKIVHETIFYYFVIWFIVFCLVLDVVQFAIVTAIDEIRVINDDMENAYNYPCIREISDNVAKALMLNPNHVIPVSNYFEETAPTAAKNAMSLYALWRVCKAGKDYIKRRWGEDYIRADFNR